VGFSTAQKYSIRRYLGFPLDDAQDPNLVAFLDDAIARVGAVAEKQTAVETILTELVTVDAAVAASGSTTTTTGALKRADDIEWHPPTTTTTGASAVTAPERGKMLINRLAICFGLTTDQLPSNYFASASGSGGNEMLLG